MYFEEERLGDHRFERDHRGIESFQMTDLQDASGARGGFDQLPARLDRVRDRLLDHDVHAQLHQLAADGSMRNCGAGHNGGIGAASQVLERR